VHVGARGGSLVHRTLAAVSPVHASEVTHLFAAVVRAEGARSGTSPKLGLRVLRRRWFLENQGVESVKY